jgi:glyoxylase-like metal-dependent hydrolase (beta-lactamase superfamily II)
MKPVVEWSYTLVLVLCVASVSVPRPAWSGDAQRYPPVDVVLNATQISPSVYYVQGAAGIATDNAGFVSNAGFVVTTEGVVVFDALGTPSLAAKLVGEIRRITPQPVRKVVLSHFHADHAYGLQVFAELGAAILASHGAVDYLSSDIARERLAERQRSLAPWVNEDTRLVMPHELVKEDYRFTLGDHEFLVTNLGSAHSEGDVALFVEPDKVLFSGDIIFEGRIPFLGSANTRNWLETLKRMERVQVNALVPGHGPMAKNPKDVLTLTRSYLQYMRDKMTDAVSDWIPFDEAYEKIDWSEFIEYPAFAEANRRNAYAVYLSMEAELLQ